MKDPLPLVVTGDKRRDLVVSTQACSDAYEAVIREHPEQWLWMMRRWNRQPETESLQACEGILKVTGQVAQSSCCEAS